MIIPRVFWIAFTIWLIWMGWKTWEMEKTPKLDHKHDRNWTYEEYFQHIKDEHPDIWKMYMADEEG